MLSVPCKERADQRLESLPPCQVQNWANRSFLQRRVEGRAQGNATASIDHRILDVTIYFNARLKELEAGYEYNGEQTCAADGMCQVKCPVGINTGELIKAIRADQLDATDKSAGHGISKVDSLFTTVLPQEHCSTNTAQKYSWNHGEHEGLFPPFWSRRNVQKALALSWGRLTYCCWTVL